MLKIKDKKLFYSIERIWFQNTINTEIHEADIERYLRMNNLMNINRLKGVYTIDSVDTLITNLKDATEEILMNNMTKTVRYEIKKCMKENVKIEFYKYDNPEIQKIIEDFRCVYTNFCLMSNQKKLIKDFDLNKVNSYIQNQCILVTKAEFLNGKVYHMYVWSTKYALLVYSASDFRNKNVDRNLAGRANKLLHFKDMLFFREMNVLCYDWGNVSNFEAPNGIDKFKMSFGGKRMTVYNVFWGSTSWGKLLVKLRKCML